MLDSASETTAGTKKGSRQSDKRPDGHNWGFNSSRGSMNTSWKSGGTSRGDYSRNDQGGWGRSRNTASTGTGGRNMQDWGYDTGGNALCFICDKMDHGWFNCPQKKGGKGCFRCGSESHQFSRCPQRRETTTTGWDISGSQKDDDLLACSISLRETHMMGVEGAPGGSRLLYYPVAIRR